MGAACKQDLRHQFCELRVGAVLYERSLHCGGRVVLFNKPRRKGLYRSDGSCYRGPLAHTLRESNVPLFRALCGLLRAAPLGAADGLRLGPAPCARRAARAASGWHGLGQELTRVWQRCVGAGGADKGGRGGAAGGLGGHWRVRMPGLQHERITCIQKSGYGVPSPFSSSNSMLHRGWCRGVKQRVCKEHENLMFYKKIHLIP